MDVAAARPAFPDLHKSEIGALQFNVGQLCNQACRHCHVDSSPARTGAHENAGASLVDDVLRLLRRETDLHTLDLTGGAPELNPDFRRLVEAARALGRCVIVRHNLTVQFMPGQDDLPRFFARNGVALYCSLPCYLEDNVDRQRGRGVYQQSVAAVRRLNSVGFGLPGSGLELHLVYNPVGPSLPPPQAQLEADYRRELRARFDLRFNRLVTITNQPIHRFRDDLVRQGLLEDYQGLLEASFNAETVPHLMCRGAISLRWDGRIYDCDFNLVRDLPLLDREGRPLTLERLLRLPSLADLQRLPITTDSHCFACTAGCGSSCGGALVP